jgi:hypothetical protein
LNFDVSCTWTHSSLYFQKLLVLITYGDMCFHFLSFFRSHEVEKVSKTLKLSQEQEKRLNNAAGAVWKEMALHPPTKKFNVLCSMLCRSVWCDGIWRFPLNCAVNQIFWKEEGKELVKSLLTVSRMHYGLSQHDLVYLGSWLCSSK